MSIRPSSGGVANVAVEVTLTAPPMHGARRPSEFVCANHSLLSGPVVIPNGEKMLSGSAYWLKTGPSEILTEPIWLKPFSANQTCPSGPPVIPRAPLLPSVGMA